MNEAIISGIQQVGIGVSNADEAWAWYRKHFGMNIPIFKDKASASLMTRYTNGKVEDRYAILAMNGQGGGGFEIWQYTSKDPLAPTTEISLGDTGIFAVKIKSRSVETSFKHFANHGINTSKIHTSPEGLKHFFVQDPFGNMFQLVESDNWLKDTKFHSGGVAGCLMGVSDIDNALCLYQSVLNHQNIVYDVVDQFADFSDLPGGKKKFRRALLKAKRDKGTFCRLLGNTEIELVELQKEKPKKIFGDRFWGDLGFIHVCFDVNGMDMLASGDSSSTFNFTVDSKNSFDMGKAAGRFTYCEDPDGSLIEFVETHKIPIAEKLGLYLNLEKRNPTKPLPNWIFSLLALNKVKD